MKLAQRKYNAGDIIYGFSSIDLMARRLLLDNKRIQPEA